MSSTTTWIHAPPLYDFCTYFQLSSLKKTNLRCTMIYVLHGVIVIRLCTRRRARFLQGWGKGKIEKREREMTAHDLQVDYKVPVEKLQLYRFESERTRVVVVYKRKIRLVNLRGGGRGEKSEELISVLLNFRCYNDSVESSTMQK